MDNFKTPIEKLEARSESIMDTLYQAGFSAEAWFIEECISDIKKMHSFIDAVEDQAHTRWKKKARELKAQILGGSIQ